MVRSERSERYDPAQVTTSQWTITPKLTARSSDNLTYQLIIPMMEKNLVSELTQLESSQRLTVNLTIPRTVEVRLSV